MNDRSHIPPLYWFLILLLCIITDPANAQISQNLYRLLPDSLRPINRAHVTFVEVQRIFINTYKLGSLPQSQYAETDSLCYLFAPKYSNVKDDRQRQEFLYSICHYLYSSYAAHTNNKTTLKDGNSPYQSPHAAEAIKYCDRFLEEYAQRPYCKLEWMGKVLLFKCHFQIELDRYKEAYNTVYKLRNLADEQKLMNLKVRAYNSLSYLFQVLSLTGQALAYADSAYQFLGNFSKDDLRANDFRMGLIQTRQQLFFDLLATTGKRQFADSIYHIHQIIISEKVEPNKLSESSSFVTIALVNYRDREYKSALANIDSAFSIYPDFANTSMGEEAIVTKGLSLMRLGKTVEGINVLQSLMFKISTGSVVLEALDELYRYELQRGNYRKALEYLGLQLQLKERQHRLDLQGRGLEMEQIYNAKTKENQIAHLEQLQSRNELISFFAIASILLILAFTLWRYRDSQVKTRGLVKRIEEAMQMQVAQIEAAVDAERKLIGQQLHDDLSASIGASLHILRMTANEKTNTKEKDHALAVSRMLEASYHRARAKSHELYLEKDSSAFWGRFSEQVGLLFSGTSINFSLNGDLSGIILSPEIKTELVMIVKESITNIVRHSRASSAEILLYDDHNQVVIEVIDNGKGFSVEQTQKMVGLRSICERAERLGGTAQWSSERNKVTVMTVKVPLDPTSD